MKFGTKLAFIFMLVGSIPLIIGGLFLFYFFDGYLKETTHSNLEKISEIVSFEVENFIERSAESISFITINPALRDENIPLDRKQEELARIQYYYQLIFRDIALLDANGTVLASSGERFFSNWQESPWFQRAKEEGVVTVTDVHPSVRSEEKVFFIIAPVENERGDVVSYIVGEIDAYNLFREIDFEVGERGKVFLLSSSGEVMYHPDPYYIFSTMDAYPLRQNTVREKGITEFFFEEEDHTAAFRVIDGNNFGVGWHLVVSKPKEEAFGFLQRMAVNYFLLSITLLLPVIIASFLLSKKIIKPLKDLSFVARRVAKGDLKAKAEIVSSDEFGDLSDNFNKMIGDLSQAKKTMEEEKDILEVKVRARTKELNELNENLEEEIQRRTEETKRKLNELEKMSKLMVGRELKMVEMKKELQKAKEEIERLNEELEEND